jgi:hypothetical protein
MCIRDSTNPTTTIDPLGLSEMHGLDDGGATDRGREASRDNVISRPGQIATRFGATIREVKDAIHQAKRNLPRGGPVRNPDVSVDPVSGEIYPQLPGGSYGDSIGNMWDLLGKG